MDRFENSALVSVNTDPLCPRHFNYAPPAAYPYPHPLHQWSADGLVFRNTVLCEVINNIIRRRPEIKSSQGVIGCVLCQFLMRGDAAAMQILPN